MLGSNKYREAVTLPYTLPMQWIKFLVLTLNLYLNLHLVNLNHALPFVRDSDSTSASREKQQKLVKLQTRLSKLFHAHHCTTNLPFTLTYATAVMRPTKLAALHLYVPASSL